MIDWIELLHQKIKIKCGRGWLVTPQGRKQKSGEDLRKDSELIIQEAVAIGTYLLNKKMHHLSETQLNDLMT